MIIYSNQPPYQHENKFVCWVESAQKQMRKFHLFSKNIQNKIFTKQLKVKKELKKRRWKRRNKNWLHNFNILIPLIKNTHLILRHLDTHSHSWHTRRNNFFFHTRRKQGMFEEGREKNESKGREKGKKFSACT